MIQRPGAEAITGLILAGGRSRRFGGTDKGLVKLHDVTMTEHVARRLGQQVGRVAISANRNIHRYEQLGYRIVRDRLYGFPGPLAGIASAVETLGAKTLAVAPCDAPAFPGDLIERLLDVMQADRADIAVVHDGSRLQPLFGIYSGYLLEDMQTYLAGGGRRVQTWLKRHRVAIADFSGLAEYFCNINNQQELDRFLLADVQGTLYKLVND